MKLSTQKIVLFIGAGVALFIFLLVTALLLDQNTHHKKHFEPILNDSIQKIVLAIEKKMEYFQHNYQKIHQKELKKEVFKKDSSRKTLLLTGDSMGDGLFMRLLQLQKQNRWQIIYKPWYGSTTKQWASCQRLADYIETYQPDLLIFTLGSNELFTKLSPKKTQFVHEIVKQMQPIPFVWVGPPNWKPDWGLDSMLQKEIGLENYFVSKELAFERKKDGAHPTPKSAAVWLDTIGNWINNNPAYVFYFQF